MNEEVTGRFWRENAVQVEDWKWKKLVRGERINKTSPLNNNSGYVMSGKTNGEVRSTEGGDLRAVYVEGEADGGRETERLIVRLMKELFFIFP